MYPNASAMQLKIIFFSNLAGNNLQTKEEKTFYHNIFILNMYCHQNCTLSSI